jgi:hypothetical protein
MGMKLVFELLLVVATAIVAVPAYAQGTAFAHGGRLQNNGFAGNNYWLDISISSAESNNFTGLTPTQPILPAPYAMMAATASRLLGATPASHVFASDKYRASPGCVRTRIFSPMQSAIVKNSKN